MITVERNQTTIVKVQLNQDRLNNLEDVVINFTSPSRTTIQLIKSLTTISSGFYYFSMTYLDALNFKDDTYSYTITQDDVELKKGFVRYIVGDGIAGLAFDYTMDFTLS